MLIINLDQIERIEISKNRTQIHFTSGNQRDLQGPDAEEFLKSIRLRNSFIEIGKNKLGIEIKEKSNG